MDRQPLLVTQWLAECRCVGGSLWRYQGPLCSCQCGYILGKMCLKAALALASPKQSRWSALPVRVNTYTYTYMSRNPAQKLEIQKWKEMVARNLSKWNYYQCVQYRLIWSWKKNVYADLFLQQLQEEWISSISTKQCVCDMIFCLCYSECFLYATFTDNVTILDIMFFFLWKYCTMLCYNWSRCSHSKLAVWLLVK